MLGRLAGTGPVLPGRLALRQVGGRSVALQLGLGLQAGWSAEAGGRGGEGLELLRGRGLGPVLELLLDHKLVLDGLRRRLLVHELVTLELRIGWVGRQEDTD